MQVEDNILTLNGMYQNYFLDYASYVILERAVPAIGDGLKPVQRRLLHSMYEMDDGRFHKVANIIGQTMQYHPHGDASIGDALVALGQKNLVVDCQGNWGDTRTGDGAAAARYIEARLSKLALDIAFNTQTTDWGVSYDGRKREPVTLPMKFPILLAQGVEGIAVGLSTKIMPHNFVELIEASIAHLKGKDFTLYPDFDGGGMVDVADYKAGKRGGKIRVRGKIEAIDKKFLAIRELPFGTTTGTLIESIVKANDKGQIKIKKVTDNTAKEVEVLIELQPGVSPDVTIDALYAFTGCEASISPNACIIIEDKPVFTDVETILRICTDQTKELLRRELEIRKHELLEKLLFASLEKIFIENRIYRDIEECETWDAVIQTIHKGLEPFTANFYRKITDDDVAKLTEIKIKRISKFNAFQADELMRKMQEELDQVLHDLEHLTDYAIAYFKNILTKYGKGRERKTLIQTFDTIKASAVVANNAKLYVDRVGGFVGTGLKKDEFVGDCSDIDDIIVIRKDGTLSVHKINDKVFVGKDIIHCAVWMKGDERTTYNMIYSDGASGVSYVKRFQVTGITRATEYPLTQGTPKSKVWHFSANPNGESEVIGIQLTQSCTAKNKKLEYDFAELEIKGRGAKGNQLTKYPIHSVKLKETGKSTLGSKQIWFDDITSRLNTDGRGRLLGAFDTGDTILALFKNGTYELTNFELTNRYDMTQIIDLQQNTADTVVSAIYFDGNKQQTFVKRFKVETTKLGEQFSYIGDHAQAKLYFATAQAGQRVEYGMKVQNKTMKGELSLDEFIDVKGWKAMGNKLTDYKITSIKEIEPVTLAAKAVEKAEERKAEERNMEEKLSVGSQIEFPIIKDTGEQTNLF
jgi:topoisomerase IV subunit A